MISFEGSKILLIGGAGFIGHNLALRLKKLGASVEIVDSLQVNNFGAFATNSDNIPNQDLYLDIINQRLDMLREARIPVLVQDARDYAAVSKIVAKLRPDVILHLAAIAHANKSNKDPYSTFGHNLRTLENTLDAARHIGLKHFVYFSSSMVYGHFSSGIVSEDTPCKPLGIYGTLKYSGELIVIAYNQVFGLPYTIVRPSALYGERCVSRRVGQIFIENAIKGLEISVNGDGSDRLDFTYIDDLVNGVVKVIENENARNQIFNLTYGNSSSLEEMANILKSHFTDIKINYLPKDKLVPDRGTLSVEKAKELIGYDPQYPLEKGFVKYIEWYKELFK